jgi:hypothetical protein
MRILTIIRLLELQTSQTWLIWPKTVSHIQTVLIAHWPNVPFCKINVWIMVINLKTSWPSQVFCKMGRSVQILSSFVIRHGIRTKLRLTWPLHKKKRFPQTIFASKKYLITTCLTHEASPNFTVFILKWVNQVKINYNNMCFTILKVKRRTHFWILRKNTRVLIILLGDFWLDTLVLVNLLHMCKMQFNFKLGL